MRLFSRGSRTLQWGLHSCELSLHIYFFFYHYYWMSGHLTRSSLDGSGTLTAKPKAHFFFLSGAEDTRRLLWRSCDLQSRPLFSRKLMRRNGGFNIGLWQASVHHSSPPSASGRRCSWRRLYTIHAPTLLTGGVDFKSATFPSSHLRRWAFSSVNRFPACLLLDDWTLASTSVWSWYTETTPAPLLMVWRRRHSWRRQPAPLLVVKWRRSSLALSLALPFRPCLHVIFLIFGPHPHHPREQVVREYDS